MQKVHEIFLFNNCFPDDVMCSNDVVFGTCCIEFIHIMYVQLIDKFKNSYHTKKSTSTDQYS